MISYTSLITTTTTTATTSRYFVCFDNDYYCILVQTTIISTLHSRNEYNNIITHFKVIERDK